MRKREAFKARSPDETGGRRWRRYRTALRLSRRPLEIAPFLNVGLILLLFLLLDSVFVLQPGVRVDLPVSGYTAGTPYGPMVVTLTQEGLAFFNDERTPLEGLGYAFAGARHRNRDVAVTVEADYRVPYGTVVRVMNMALEAGIRTVNLATQPAFEREYVPWED